MSEDDKKREREMALARESYKQENDRLERYDYISKVLNSAVEQYGLMRGQQVKKHVRKDPRTGQRFVAGQGGSGSPRSVLGQGQTVAGNIRNVGELAGKMKDGFLDQEKIHVSPDDLQTVLKNLENSSEQELQTMAEDLLQQPPSRKRGTYAELWMKEVLRRGLLAKVTMEKEKEKQEKEEKQKEKEKQKKENDANRG
jgi:hypothetical protein